MNLITPYKPRFLKDKLIFASLLLTLFAVSFPAYAELGGDEASIQTDQVVFLD